MKNINIILILLTLSLSSVYAVEDVNASSVDAQEEIVEDVVVEEDTMLEDELDYEIDDEILDEELEDVNKTKSAFEKLFVNHTAYIYYTTAMQDIFSLNYKSAYENAMKAKAIYDNTDVNDSQVIALPYMPSYMRESGFTSKRIYYKMLKPKPYELKRLITKIKLVSPPIASIVIKRTSTYLEVITRNYGDLPLDDFEVLVNDESLVKYEKILPSEQKIIRVELAPILYELSFKEKYGFAPNSMMLSEGE